MDQFLNQDYNIIFRAKGRVVNMASGLGRMMVPSRSVYAITKWGVEGFSDCLRYEMTRWGVKVSNCHRSVYQEKVQLLRRLNFTVT